MVVATIAELLSGVVSGGTGKKLSGDGPAASSSGRRLPSWYKPRRRGSAQLVQHIVDLDGPMEELAPFVGRGAISRKGQKRKG